ncbi:hypothetical protein BH09BAC3_BH09BAC3_13920 [soil metagenome]
MDLQQVWKKLEKDKLEKPVSGAVTIAKKSKHPVQKLKAAYLQTTAFSILFLILFIVLFFLFDEWLVKGGLILVIFSYIFYFVLNFSMYRKVNVVLPVDGSLKTALEHTYSFITDNIRFQKRTSLYIYPIAGTAGFLMGGSISSGNINELMQNKYVLILGVVVMAILTPACYLLSNWMYKITYGKCLKELKERIAELENPA